MYMIEMICHITKGVRSGLDRLERYGKDLCAYHPVDGDNFAENDTEGGDTVSCLLVKSSRYGKLGYLIKFLVEMRGVFTPAPRMDEPVTKIPLWAQNRRERG